MHPIEKFSTATGEWWLPTDNEIDIVIKAMKSGDFFEGDIVEAARRFISQFRTNGGCFFAHGGAGRGGSRI